MARAFQSKLLCWQDSASKLKIHIRKLLCIVKHRFGLCFKAAWITPNSAWPFSFKHINFQSLEREKRLLSPLALSFVTLNLWVLERWAWTYCTGLLPFLACPSPALVHLLGRMEGQEGEGKSSSSNISPFCSPCAGAACPPSGLALKVQG